MTRKRSMARAFLGMSMLVTACGADSRQAAHTPEAPSVGEAADDASVLEVPKHRSPEQAAVHKDRTVLDLPSAGRCRRGGAVVHGAGPEPYPPSLADRVLEPVLAGLLGCAALVCHGRIELSFGLGDDGRVSQLSVCADGDQAPLSSTATRCIHEILVPLRFPPHPQSPRSSRLRYVLVNTC